LGANPTERAAKSQDLNTVDSTRKLTHNYERFRIFSRSATEQLLTTLEIKVRFPRRFIAQRYVPHKNQSRQTTYRPACEYRDPARGERSQDDFDLEGGSSSAQYYKTGVAYALHWFLFARCSRAAHPGCYLTQVVTYGEHVLRDVGQAP
jgi:hypothetical protein